MNWLTSLWVSKTLPQKRRKPLPLLQVLGKAQQKLILIPPEIRRVLASRSSIWNLLIKSLDFAQDFSRSSRAASGSKRGDSVKIPDFHARADVEDTQCRDHRQRKWQLVSFALLPSHLHFWPWIVNGQSGGLLTAAKPSVHQSLGLLCPSLVDVSVWFLLMVFLVLWR